MNPITITAYLCGDVELALHGHRYRSRSRHDIHMVMWTVHPEYEAGPHAVVDPGYQAVLDEQERQREYARWHVADGMRPAGMVVFAINNRIVHVEAVFPDRLNVPITFDPDQYAHAYRKDPT